MNKSNIKKKSPQGKPEDYMTTKKHGVVMESDFQKVVAKMLKTPPMPKGK